MLNPQEIHHIGGRQNFINILGNRHTQLFEVAGDEGAWSDQSYASAEFEKRKDIRPRDPAKKNVSDNDDVESGYGALFFPDCVDVEQCLGRVFVGSVTSVDDAGF